MGKVIQFPIVKIADLPTIAEQMDTREEIILQAIMKNYSEEYAVAVGLACTAASDVLANGGDSEQAFKAADLAIQSYRAGLVHRGVS